jgi:hypothetical protein
LLDRRLAGDARAGSWARAKARRRQIDFLHENWRSLVALTLVAAAFIGGLAYFAPAGFVRGLTVGVLGTALVGALFVLTLEVTGTAATRMGGTAEQWTASELRPLRRSGWRLMNHYMLGDEIDHLLIGPAGVVVAETKWSRSQWRLDPPDHYAREALTQVKDAARQVGLWSEVRRAGCVVRPVLFLWSAEQKTSNEDKPRLTFIDGVSVVQGRRAAKAWRERVEAAVALLPGDTIDTLANAAIEHLTDRDLHEATRNREPPSMDRLLQTTFGCFVAGIGGILSILEPLSHRLYWLAAAVGAAGIALGLYVHRFRSLRLIADAWLAGIVGIGAFAATVLALA